MASCLSASPGGALLSDLSLGKFTHPCSLNHSLGRCPLQVLCKAVRRTRCNLGP